MDKKDIYELIDRFEESDLTELILEQGGDSLTLKRGGGMTQPMVHSVVPTQMAGMAAAPLGNAAASAQDTAPVVEQGEVVSAPIVGTFYRSASPDAPPYVEVGTVVKKGQTICIIEAMKSMNEIPAEFDFEVLDILVENGVPIEFDAPLFRVKPL